MPVLVEALEPRALFTAVVFTLNPDSSTITISGNVGGLALAEQAAGSLTAHYGGTSHRDVAGSTIAFTGGGPVDAVASADNRQPGGTPADYAATVQAGAV